MKLISRIEDALFGAISLALDDAATPLAKEEQSRLTRMLVSALPEMARSVAPELRGLGGIVSAWLTSRSVSREAQGVVQRSLFESCEDSKGMLATNPSPTVESLGVSPKIVIFHQIRPRAATAMQIADLDVNLQPIFENTLQCQELTLIPGLPDLARLPQYQIFGTRESFSFVANDVAMSFETMPGEIVFRRVRRDDRTLVHYQLHRIGEWLAYIENRWHFDSTVVVDGWMLKSNETDKFVNKAFTEVAVLRFLRAETEAMRKSIKELQGAGLLSVGLMDSLRDTLFEDDAHS